MDKRKDDYLPYSKFKQTYGRTEIAVTDWAGPAFRMTFSLVANMLRGIALYMSMHGWWEVSVGVFDAGVGHVGAGHVSRFTPRYAEAATS